MPKPWLVEPSPIALIIDLVGRNLGLAAASESMAHDTRVEDGYGGGQVASLSEEEGTLGRM